MADVIDTPDREFKGPRALTERVPRLVWRALMLSGRPADRTLGTSQRSRRLHLKTTGVVEGSPRSALYLARAGPHWWDPQCAREPPLPWGATWGAGIPGV